MHDLKKTVLLSTVALALNITGNTYGQVTTVIPAGLDDNFVGPPDPAEPSSTLLAVLPPFGGVQDFDMTHNLNGGSPNTNVAHTFTNLPTNIIRAVLTTRVRASNWPTGVDTDGLILSFVENSLSDYISDIEWARTFGPFGGGGSVFSEPDPTGLLGAWSHLDQTPADIVLDLSALPMIDGSTTNILPLLRCYGFLDVTVGDETAADFYRLELTLGPSIIMRDPSVSLDDVHTGPSGVTNERFLFSEPVLFTDADVTITDSLDSPVPFSVSGSNTQYMLISFGSPLINDDYTITIADTVLGVDSGEPIDGDNNGVAGGNAVIVMKHRRRIDSNNDFNVNVTDLLDLLASWGTLP